VIAPLLTVTIAAVAAGTSLAGQAPLALAVLTCQCLLVAGWSSALPMSLPMSRPRAGMAVAVGAGLVADGLMLVRADDASMTPLLTVAAAAFGVALVQHLRHADLAALASTVTVSVLVVLMSALVAERGAAQGRVITVAVILATGVAAAVGGLGRDGSLRTPVAALGVAAGTGVLAGLAAPDLGVVRGVAVCFAAGLFAVVAHRVATFALGPPPATESSPAVEVGAAVPGGRAAVRAARKAATKAARRQDEAALLLHATLPLALAAPAAYILGRLLVG
jgi:hypothetical protein